MIDDERQEEGQGAAETEGSDEPTADSPQPTEEQPEAEAQEPPAEEPAGEEPAAEEPEEPAAEEPAAEEPAAEEPAAEEPTPEEPVAEEPTAEEQPAEEPPSEEQPAEPVAEEPPADSRQPTADEAQERARHERKPRDEGKAEKPDVVPGAHLEPDLVLEEQAAAESEFPGYQEEAYEGQPESADDGERPTVDEAPAARTPLDLAADARYHATGKRKTSVARVILRPGSGAYTINGRPLDEFFPRPTLQRTARQPLETAGYETRMDVIAKIHGGGVSSQAGALRHGVARALVEADPNLRGELKRRGFLTRDARAKERKKAGLKKARKRPQFSKR